MNKASLADWIFSLNKKLYYNLRYFYFRGHFINFKHPQNLSEYLFAEMLKPSFKQYAIYADKVAVRDYVRKKGLEAILPQCYGVWNSVDEIDFNILPIQFALKTNHGCGNHIICHDKKTLDIKHTKEKLRQTLQQRFSIREPHYQHIKPKVFAEELINDSHGMLPIDYKFMCTKGKPLCILVCSDRKENFKEPLITAMDSKWNKLPWIKGEKTNKLPERPFHLQKMVEYAKILSQDFDFVRVDFYDTPNQIFFGELTFTPHSGFLAYYTEEALELMAKDLK